MEEDRNNWPVIMGITAGVVGGIVAALFLYSVTSSCHRGQEELLDAQDIIARCHENIRQIEDALDALKRPTAA
ncbi:MAG TPA: hypothetical protein VMX94_00575 [Armatimonadota bacterium]|nr:hypothetical protein [Armatimonadota bacterium]